MPVYEYNCGKCGKSFEVTSKISDSDKKVKCPACGSKECYRVFSSFLTGNSCSESSTTRTPRVFG